MLDLAGYTVDRNLAATRLLEPSCGHGAFVLPAIERLLAVCAREAVDVSTLPDAITAIDIDGDHVARCREQVVTRLTQHGLDASSSRALAARWIVQADALIHPMHAEFDFIVGNPPYVRIEQISPVLQSEYRARFYTLYDRADLYVAFIQRAISLLSATGRLCFICADRWVLNRYGSLLRALISRECKVEAYIGLHHASPFESEVIAYPSIFSLSRGKSDRVFVGEMQEASEAECRSMLHALREPPTNEHFCDGWFDGDEPWVLGTPAQQTALKALERRYYALEDDGETRVGIGVATGCDRVFIVDDDADIEPDRLVRLVMRADLSRGKILDRKRRVLNVFDDAGGVIKLNAYPRLEKYLRKHADDVRGRHVAKRNPNAWFRTIDKVSPALVATPKLLIPDIAGSNEVVFDHGGYHPHHNLYFVTSTRWDLEVLGALLSSRVALFFVWCYAVKMRGGYLRFQAQYLRRIRVPPFESLSDALRAGLRDAFRARDFATIDALALAAWQIDTLPVFDFVDTRK